VKLNVAGSSQVPANTSTGDVWVPDRRNWQVQFHLTFRHCNQVKLSNTLFLYTCTIFWNQCHICQLWVSFLSQNWQYDFAICTTKLHFLHFKSFNLLNLESKTFVCWYLPLKMLSDLKPFFSNGNMRLMIQRRNCLIYSIRIDCQSKRVIIANILKRKSLLLNPLISPSEYSEWKPFSNYYVLREMPAIEETPIENF